MNEHLKTLKDIQDKKLNFILKEGIGNQDCKKLIKDASKNIRYLAYECTNTVTREEDRVTTLKVNPPGDGGKAPAQRIEIFQDCEIMCKVEVKDRKLPLKLHITYHAEDAETTFVKKSLIVYASTVTHYPTKENCTHTFVNPSGKILIDDSNPYINTGRKQNSVADSFNNDSVHLSLNSRKGCIISIACQFPNEVEKDD